MKNKAIICIIILFLIAASGLASGINLNVEYLETQNENNNEGKDEEIFSSLGIGGWHQEVTLDQYGRDFSDIYKIGGNEGYWESPYDTYGVHMVADHNRIRAEYTFNAGDGPVKYVKYQIEYKDTSLFSDGPDALIYKWDNSWDSKSNIAGEGNTELFYQWQEHTFNQNGNKYVNDDGKIRVAAQAYDDDSWLQQDKIAVKTMRISYCSADEEIFLLDVIPYDSDDDNSSDSVEVQIDADVGDDGDGTTVEVTAYCELIDPNQNVVDSESTTWTIVDHQIDQGVVHLSSLGGINGMYTVSVILYDEYGNNEEQTTENIYLVPDPQRTIVFLVDPAEGGAIQFEDELFYDNLTTTDSDDTYEISAINAEYYEFSYWEDTGGVRVADVDNPNTTVTVTDNGTLKAVFEYLLNAIYFYVVPDYAGVIQIEDLTFENGTDTLAYDGVYNIQALTAENNYYFYIWEGYGGLQIEDVNSFNTTVEISGDCAIVAYFGENIPPEKPLQPDGPIAGGIHTEYTYSTSTTDQDGNELYYWFDWGDGTDSGWLGPYESGQQVKAKHKWAGARVYNVKVKAKDGFGAESPWSDALPVGIYSPPNAPIITGPTSGKKGVEYEFTISAVDPDDDDVYFYIDWGDENIMDWDGPYESGQQVKVSHKWSSKGKFTVKALAKDENDIVSESWGMLVINLPKAKPFNSLLANFFEKNPRLFSILQNILDFINLKLG